MFVDCGQRLASVGCTCPASNQTPRLPRGNHIFYGSWPVLLMLYCNELTILIASQPSHTFSSRSTTTCVQPRISRESRHNKHRAAGPPTRLCWSVCARLLCVFLVAVDMTTALTFISFTSELSFLNATPVKRTNSKSHSDHAVTRCNVVV